MLLYCHCPNQLHLYKGCYQLIAGANPLMAHAMFNRTGTFSSVRRRANKASVILLKPHNFFLTCNASITTYYDTNSTSFMVVYRLFKRVTIHVHVFNLWLYNPPCCHVIFCLLCSVQEEDGCNPALCSHEHAMAKLMAYKHLPPSMESPYSQSSLPTPTKRRSPTLQSAPTRV